MTCNPFLLHILTYPLLQLKKEGKRVVEKNGIRIRKQETSDTGEIPDVHIQVVKVPCLLKKIQHSF